MTAVIAIIAPNVYDVDMFLISAFRSLFTDEFRLERTAVKESKLTLILKTRISVLTVASFEVTNVHTDTR